MNSTFVLLVKNGETFPIFHFDQISKCIAKCDWMWEEIDGVIRGWVEFKVPSGLHVWHVQYITSGLYVGTGLH